MLLKMFALWSGVVISTLTGLLGLLIVAVDFHHGATWLDESARFGGRTDE